MGCYEAVASPRVRFEVHQSTFDISNDNVHGVVVELRLPQGVGLTNNAEFQIVDLESGSAQPEIDYTIDISSIFSFAAGSPNGDRVVIGIELPETAHINGIESFWSYAKRRLIKFNGVPKETFYLQGLT